MDYERINWLNEGEAGAKPINKTNLNKMDEAIAYLFENGTGGGGDNTPIGTVFAYGGETAPNGYLLANGQAISRTEYADLFKVYGTTYGEGDGNTTFNLPDFRDKVPVGLNVNTEYFNMLGKTGGEYEHTLTLGELPSHSPSINMSSAVGSNYDTVVAGNTFVGGSTTVANTLGENQPHNNLQPYIVTNYIIKATKVTPTQAEVEDSLESNSTTNAPSIHAVNEALLDSLYYKDGDTHTTTNTYMSGFGSFITSSMTAIQFDVMLPKIMKNIERVDVSALRLRARSITGTYLLSGSSTYCDVFTNKTSNGADLSANCTSVTAQIVSENQLRITVKFDNTVYELNNCPIALEYRNMELTFNSTSAASE